MVCLLLSSLPFSTFLSHNTRHNTTSIIFSACVLECVCTSHHSTSSIPPKVNCPRFSQQDGYLFIFSSRPPPSSSPPLFFSPLFFPPVQKRYNCSQPKFTFCRIARGGVKTLAVGIWTAAAVCVNKYCVVLSWKQQACSKHGQTDTQHGLTLNRVMLIICVVVVEEEVLQ